MSCFLFFFVCSFQISSDGNWMHIQYQSKLQAKKALSKNGKIFGDSIMLGVTPCIDKVITPLHFSHLATLILKLQE